MKVKSFKRRLKFSCGSFRMRNAIILLDDNGLPVGVSRGWTCPTGGPDGIAIYVYPIWSNKVYMEFSRLVDAENLPARLVEQLLQIAVRDDWKRIYSS